jgi:hypothetical protein
MPTAISYSVFDSLISTPRWRLSRNVIHSIERRLFLLVMQREVRDTACHPVRLGGGFRIMMSIGSSHELVGNGTRPRCL